MFLLVRGHFASLTINKNVHMAMMMSSELMTCQTHEGHLHENGVLTWFCNETATMVSHI